MKTPSHRPRTPTVALLSAPGTLPRVDAAMERAGVRLVRIRSVEPKSVAPSAWLRRVSRRPLPDTVIVTSRWAVRAGLRPWVAAEGPLPRGTEVWAVGPATAHALRQAGVSRVRTPRTIGSDAIAREMASGPKRRIVYLRSNLAGGTLVRALRAHGHRVTDAVVYNVEMPPPLTTRERAVVRSADVVLVTSPSGLADLAYRLGRSEFARFARTTRLLVLGERSGRAARARHIAHVSVVPSAVTQPFTRRLLREVRDARG